MLCYHNYIQNHHHHYQQRLYLLCHFRYGEDVAQRQKVRVAFVRFFCFFLLWGNFSENNLLIASKLQACSCQNVFYSYYESGGSGQTSSTEVKSLGGEESAYQLPYMVVMRPPAPPTTLGLPSQAANIYMEIEPGDAIAPLSAPPRPSSAPGPSLMHKSSSSVVEQARRAEALPTLSPIQVMMMMVMVMMMMIARKKLQTNCQLCPPCRSPSTRLGNSSFTSTSSLVRRGANCDKNSELKKLHRCPVFTYIPLQVEIGLSVSPSWLWHKGSGWGVAG